MELTKILQTRKSVRSFTGEPISNETRRKLLLAANASPVGQAKYDSVHLTVVKSTHLLAEIEQNTAAVFGVEKRSFLYGAPELIIVSTKETDNVGYSNAAIIAHDMSLAAVDAGVGVCHIWGCTIALCANESLVRRLGVPKGFSPACAIAVGKTNDQYTEREIPEDRIGINEV